MMTLTVAGGVSHNFVTLRVHNFSDYLDADLMGFWISVGD